jgi:hypothetical protein
VQIGDTILIYPYLFSSFSAVSKMCYMMRIVRYYHSLNSCHTLLRISFKIHSQNKYGAPWFPPLSSQRSDISPPAR